MRARLQVGAVGEIVLPPREAERLGVVGDHEVEVLSARGAFAIVAPARAESPRSWMAGSLEALTVPELIQQLSTSLRTGMLLLAFADDGEEPSAEEQRRKCIYFRDGQVVYATSADPAERLGSVLVRAGKLSEEDLERCSHLVVRGNRRLGQVLVDQGILTSGQVYEGLVLQVKEILLNAFVETGGTFAFLEGALDEVNAVKLPERTRDLLLAGLKRVEEAEELTRTLGGLDPVLARASATVRSLDAAEARLLEELDGPRTVKQAASAAGLDYLDALRAAATLVQEGTLAPRQAEGKEEGGVDVADAEAVVRAVFEAEKRAAGAPRGGGPFETYRQIFIRVYAALAARQPDVHHRLNSYFARLPAKLQPLWDGVRFGPSGDLDVARVLANVSATGVYQGAAARARALESLEDLRAFALFEVKNCLPKAEAEQLLREVGRMRDGET